MRGKTLQRQRNAAQRRSKQACNCEEKVKARRPTTPHKVRSIFPPSLSLLSWAHPSRIHKSLMMTRCPRWHVPISPKQSKSPRTHKQACRCRSFRSAKAWRNSNEGERHLRESCHSRRGEFPPPRPIRHRYSTPAAVVLAYPDAFRSIYLSLSPLIFLPFCLPRMSWGS